MLAFGRRMAAYRRHLRGPHTPEGATDLPGKTGTPQLAFPKRSKFARDVRQVEAPSDVKLGASITLPSAELRNNVFRVFCPVKRQATG
jgi:hypothetical protein